MNRVVIQSGYSMPFAGASKKRRGAKRSKRRSSPALKRQQAKMKACAKSWKTGKYQAHMKRCLSK